MRLAISSEVGSRPNSCTSCRDVRINLIDGLDHVHRDTNGARLIGDRAGDGLPDPPGCIG